MTDLRSSFLLKRAEKLTVEEREKLLGPLRQATRYPVFKDVSKLWKYDFAAEEKKRFKATPVWVPNPKLSDQDLTKYITRVH